MKRKAIGIDLGTTNCCIAWMEGDQIVVYQDEQGRSTIPSIVAQSHEGEIMVGWRAKNCETPLYRHGFSKRALGSKQNYHLKDGPVSAVRISALLLKELKTRAEAKLGCEIAAVVTVPAHFQQVHREETRQAAQEAGLELIDLLQEPIAAAIAYYHEEAAQRTTATPSETILVYDLGGGTMDATVCVRRGEHIEIGALGLAYEGDKYLGGVDFDKALVGLAAAQLAGQGFKTGTLTGTIAEDLLSSQWLWELLSSAERCKQRLSDEWEVQWTKELIGHNPERRATLNYWATRKEFEEVIKHLVDKTLECCDGALITHARRLAAANRTKTKEELLKQAAETLDRIILVGGSTLVPCIKQRVREHYQKICDSTPDIRGFRPYECVAIGAAIYSATRGLDGGTEHDTHIRWVSGPRDVGQAIGLHPNLIGVVSACKGSGWQIELKVGTQTARKDVQPDGNFYLPAFAVAPGENSLELTIFNNQGLVHGRQTCAVRRGGLTIGDPGLAHAISVRLVDGMHELIPAGTHSGGSPPDKQFFINDKDNKARAPLYEGHYPISTIEFSANGEPGTPVTFRTIYRPGKLDVETTLAGQAPEKHELKLESFSYTGEEKALRERFRNLLQETEILLNDLPQEGALGEQLRREWQTLKLDIETEFANKIVLDLNRIEDRVWQLELLMLQLQSYSTTAEGLRRRAHETRKMIGSESDLLEELEVIEVEITENKRPEELAASAARLRELRRNFYHRYPPEIDEKLIEIEVQELRRRLETIQRDAEGAEAVLKEAREIEEGISQVVNSRADNRTVFNRLSRLEQEHVNELYQKVVIRKSQQGLLRSTR